MKSSKLINSNTSEWKWGTLTKIIIYTFCGIVFSTAIFIDTDSRNDKDITIKDLYIVSLNLIGFIGLFIFQIVNKWIYGLIIIGLTLLINIWSFIDILKRLKII
tara:strand:+ start:1598 stop:1909 length:312 start_codon:yes stop_codon:yes gene_type:complete